MTKEEFKKLYLFIELAPYETLRHLTVPSSSLVTHRCCSKRQLSLKTTSI